MVRNLRVGGLLLAIASSLVYACSAKADLKGNLTVEVNNLQTQKGEDCIKLFSGGKGFPDSNENAVKRCVQITENPMTFTFENLSFGSYAVAVFHDLNGDHKLNRNSLGVPTEEYGFSNNPVIRQGPPKFADCVFLVAGPNTTIQIQMRNSTGS